MYTTAFNVDESDAMFARTDPEVEKAVDMMPKAIGAVGYRQEDHRAAHEFAALAVAEEGSAADERRDEHRSKTKKLSVFIGVHRRPENGCGYFRTTANQRKIR